MHQNLLTWKDSMDPKDSKEKDSGFSRREFLGTAAVVGAGLVLSGCRKKEETPPPGAQAPTGPPGPEPEPPEPATKPFEYNVALIGAGKQGRVLLNCMLKIPGIRIKAISDIWPYSRKFGLGITSSVGKQKATGYEDYREMLDKEKDLDAVIVATPDWTHSEITCAALAAKKHVYCEKEMSNSLEGARKMVEAAKASGKLLQIGHQRRSNPRYFHSLKMIEIDKMLGNITVMYGQWNRPVQILELPAKAYQLDDETLKKYGYDTMERFMNWRWYKKFGGGSIADLGSHQIDVFNWFLHSTPIAVTASGGLDYARYRGEKREWYDTVMAIYEYNIPHTPDYYPEKPKGDASQPTTTSGPTTQGALPDLGPRTVRGFYQVLNTTSSGAYYETFMGDLGTMQISEDSRIGFVFKEQQAPRKPWEDDAIIIEKGGVSAIEMKVRYSIKDPAQLQQIKSQLRKPVHQLHLENFFAAIRDNIPLNCPPEVGYETAVTVLKVNEAVEAGRRLEFKSEEFKA